MSKLIIANWKTNPATEAEAIQLAASSDQEGLVICPPFPFVKAVRSVLKKASLGVQDLAEMSADELRDMGVRYVIIGHSDRRIHVGETNESISKKVAVALEQGLTPILCVGEQAEERASGKKEAVLRTQLTEGLREAQRETTTREMHIAYEPVWAISTNPNAVPDKPEYTAETLQFLRGVLKELSVQHQVHFLYGGSVTAANAEGFLGIPDVAGALVGGASLKAEEITRIVNIAKKF